jgi:hypothetical protein
MHPSAEPPRLRRRYRRLPCLLLTIVVGGGGAACSPASSPGAPSAPVSATASATGQRPAVAATTPSAGPLSGPVATPTPSPTSTPTLATPSGPNESLTKNTIYTIDLSHRRVSCALTVRRPKPPLRNSELAPYLRRVVGCLVKAFEVPLDARGIPVATPKIKTYGRTIKTPCGKFSQGGSPAYYCGTNRTIYWAATRDDGNEAYTFARLGYVGLAAHEFGHHLQSMSGMLGGYAERYSAARRSPARYLLSRRLELQAQCFEGVFLSMTKKTLSYTSSDRYQLRVWHGYTGDEDSPASRRPDHGTSAAQIRWLYRGLDSGDLSRCNTWTAPTKLVK